MAAIFSREVNSPEKLLKRNQPLPPKMKLFKVRNLNMILQPVIKLTAINKINYLIVIANG